MGSPRSRESPYSTGSFYGVRLLSLISLSIVAGILIYFTIHLHQNGYRLPWAFLVLICTAVLGLVNLIFITLLHSCQNLSPTLSLVMNVIILIPWIISIGLLSWNMRGTLTISCTTTNWGNSTGVSVCQLYKAMFSFLVISIVLQIATIFIDTSARRRKHSLVAYDAMYSDGNLADIKLANHESVNSYSNQNLDPNDRRANAYNAFGVVRPNERRQDSSTATATSDYQSQVSRARSESQTGGYQNAYRRAEAASLERHHAGEAQEFYDNVPLPPVNTAWSHHDQGSAAVGTVATGAVPVAKPTTPAQQYIPFRPQRNDEQYGYSSIPNSQVEQPGYDTGYYRR